MKAAVHTDAFKLTLMERPTPEVTDYDHALLKVGAVGICGSDKHDLDHPPMAEQIPGHEFSGIIAELGAEPGDFKVGDRVVVRPQARCGICEDCIRKPRLPCEKGGVYGCRGNNQPPGAMAEYVLVRTENLYAVPDAISLEEAAMADPLAVAIHSVNVGPDVKGQKCVVLGAGAIGILLGQVLKLRGASRVALVDIVPSHLAVAREMGDFDCLLSDDSDALFEALREMHSGIYYELAGGEAPTLNIAIQSIEKAGHIMLISQRPKGAWIDYQTLLFKGLHLHGVAGTSLAAWDEALNLLFERRVTVLPLITHRYPLEEATEALLAAMKGDALKVMIKPNGEIG